ncbi:MAG: dihydrofolate reductase [Zoogloeaceae bacterium]|nr:dihydrofolate reductase [Zoogloeaceae bacterium]
MAHSVTLIAAVARNRVIGRANELVWRSPEDMARFKALTLGHVVVMGRKTWESLPPRFRPLPGRRNIVVTRQNGYSAPGAEVAHSLSQSLDLADQQSVFIMGGGDLYAQALPLADRLVLTEVNLSPTGDTYFPIFSRDDWGETERSQHVDPHGVGFDFVTYHRVQRTQST